MFVSSSSMEVSALQIVMIMPALLLQKPSKHSKAKDHTEALKRRLQLWEQGKLDELLREGKAIQSHLQKSAHKSGHTEKVFVRLMLQGKVGAAMRWIGSSATGILEATPDVKAELTKKHPMAKPATEDSLLHGPVNKIEPVIFDNIEAELIQDCAKRTKGAAGPSGLDSDGWQRILCSKRYGKKSLELCEAIGKVGRRLCRDTVDPEILRSYIACRLVPLDKKPGVRPVGIGEVLRRIIGKAVMTVVQKDMAQCTAPIQVCAGLPGGVEAAVHAAKEAIREERHRGAHTRRCG